MKKIVALVLMMACMFCMASCDVLSALQAAISAPVEKEPENGQSITKEEWESALNFAIPVTRSTQHVYWSADINQFLYYTVSEFGNNVVREYHTDRTFTEIISDMYRVKDGESCIGYVLSDKTGVWVKSTLPLSDYTYMYDALNGNDGQYGIAEMFPYENFVYDELKQAYVCDELVVDNATYFDIAIVIKDGRLESYSMRVNLYGDSMTIDSTFSYDTVEIILPNVE